MKHPGDQEIGWKAVVQINARFVCAAIILFYGWLCWQMASIEWWGFYLLGPMCLFAGSLEALRAIYRAVQLVLARRRWKRFQKLGNRPKADGMVQDRDFETGGRS